MLVIHKNQILVKIRRDAKISLMASSSPSHLSKNKYSNIFASDLLVENQEMREKEHKKCLLMERFHYKTCHLYTHCKNTAQDGAACNMSKSKRLPGPSQHHMLQQPWVDPTSSAEAVLIKSFSASWKGMVEHLS